MCYFTIKDYSLTNSTTSVLVQPNVRFSAAVAFQAPSLYIQLTKDNPVFNLEAGVYGTSKFSIANELIPYKIIPEETNERRTMYFIHLSLFDQSIEVIDYDIEFDESILFRKGSK